MGAVDLLGFERAGGLAVVEAVGYGLTVGGDLLAEGVGEDGFLFIIFTDSAAFSRKVYEILTEDELISLQRLLVMTPDAEDLIPGSKGLRRIRVASDGKEKREVRAVERGEIAPARVREVTILPDGAMRRVELDPETCRGEQARA